MLCHSHFAATNRFCQKTEKHTGTDFAQSHDSHLRESSKRRSVFGSSKRFPILKRIRKIQNKSINGNHSTASVERPPRILRAKTLDDSSIDARHDADPNFRSRLSQRTRGRREFRSEPMQPPKDLGVAIIAVKPHRDGKPSHHVSRTFFTMSSVQVAPSNLAFEKIFIDELFQASNTLPADRPVLI